MELRAWWATRLGMPLTRFEKTCYDKRPREVNLTEDYHGVCILRCLDTYLQQRILGLAHSYLESATSVWVQKSSLAIYEEASELSVGGTGLEPVNLLRVEQAL